MTLWIQLVFLTNVGLKPIYVQYAWIFVRNTEIGIYKHLLYGVNSNWCMDTMYVYLDTLVPNMVYYWKRMGALIDDTSDTLHSEFQVGVSPLLDSGATYSFSKSKFKHSYDQTIVCVFRLHFPFLLWSNCWWDFFSFRKLHDPAAAHQCFIIIAIPQALGVLLKVKRGHSFHNRTVNFVLFCCRHPKVLLD